MSVGEGRSAERDAAFVDKLRDRLRRQPNLGVIVITVSDDAAAPVRAAKYGLDAQGIDAAAKFINGMGKPAT